MRNEDALEALSALGHPRRLDAFRLLMASGRDGLLAGEIADRLSAKQNTMSTNLAVLLRARLVNAQREGRGVRYTANMETFTGLLRFLVRDCAKNHPDLLAEFGGVIADWPGERQRQSA